MKLIRNNELIKLILSIVLLFSILFPMNVYASETTDSLVYNNLDEIDEDLEIFKTISSGTISAVQENGEWYYQFRRGNYRSVRIKADAFTSAPNNSHLIIDNEALSEHCRENYSRICYYNTVKFQKGILFDTYTVSMYRFSLENQGLTDDEFTLKCKLTHGVTFTIKTKVEAGFDLQKNNEQVHLNTNLYDAYVIPSTPTEYQKGISRSASISDITPTINVRVGNTGDNSVCFSTYTLCGVGEASTSVDVNSFVQIACSLTELLISNDENQIGPLIQLVDIIGKFQNTLNKTSDLYNTGESIMLSKAGQNPTLEVEYKSPITLSNVDDWIQITTHLNTSKFSSARNGTDASFIINFSFE